MRKVTQAVTLFFSTTNDPNTARRKAIVERIAKRVGDARDVVIRILHWQDNIPGGVAGDSGQTRIDAEIEDAFDIYFGCMGTKFGGGTVQEFERAIQSYIAKGHPCEVLFGFDASPVNPFELPANFLEVKAFRTSLQSSTKFGRSILYFDFANDEELEDRLFRDLNEAVRKARGRTAGGALPFR